MNNGFYYQVTLSFLKESTRFNVPRYLKELNRSGNIENVDTLRKFMQDEIVTTPLSEDTSVNYFLFLVDHALLFDFYRGDFSGYFDILDILGKRYQLMDQLGLKNVDLENWKKYTAFLEKAARRIQGHITIEDFELEIDEIEWTDLGKDFIYRISGLIGYVYLSEKDAGKKNKGKFWLQKAVTESTFDQGFIFFKNLADFYLTNPTPDNLQRLEMQIAQLNERATATPDMMASRLYKACIFELQALLNLNRFGFDDETVKADHGVSAIKNMEKSMRQMVDDDNIPSFVKSFLKSDFARHYARLSGEVSDAAQAKKLNRLSNDHIDDAIQIAQDLDDILLTNVHKMTYVELQGKSGETLTEKEIKEISQYFKKTDHFGLFANAVKTHGNFFLEQGNSKKAYDVALELIRFGNKRIESGGLQLVDDGFEFITTVFRYETTKPGVSWIVDELESFFKRIEDLIQNVEGLLEEIGSEEFNRFALIFNSFRPISHFNIKIYYRFQLANVRMMRLIALEREDELALNLVNSLMSELLSDENPLSFITADWEEFKDVPNSVRNKTLNKCISISKGDLPLAAEHLDFSYRNLRSYITFKEVNRLGFFLGHQDTTVKQLEQGIRLMFHDLYKRGTIFEVVFDMPKFLVDYAHEGFSSQDMETSLNIKGTTAKKYIKIMMEVGLINQEKSVGRKHYYKLRRDNVMTRLGKEQKVLVG